MFIKANYILTAEKGMRQTWGQSRRSSLFNLYWFEFV
jgi:hypothetical protein